MLNTTSLILQFYSRSSVDITDHRARARVVAFNSIVDHPLLSANVNEFHDFAFNSIVDHHNIDHMLKKAYRSKHFQFYSRSS